MILARGWTAITAAATYMHDGIYLSINQSYAADSDDMLSSMAPVLKMQIFQKLKLRQRVAGCHRELQAASKSCICS